MSCASPPSFTLGLSWLTTMKPRAGVLANSAASSETVSVAVASGATVSNIPVLTDGVKALKLAVAGMVSKVPSVRPKLSTVEPSRGLAAERHGCFALQSWAKRTGRTLHAAFAHFWQFDGTQFTALQQATDTGMWRDALG